MAASLRVGLVVFTGFVLAACHFATHVPPGHSKKMVLPPPGKEKKWQ